MTNQPNNNQPNTIETMSNQVENQAEAVANQAKAVVDRVDDQAEAVAEQAQAAPQQAEKLSDQLASTIESAKEILTQPLPTAPTLSSTEASPEELLKRLNWGEPALTIIDIRSREAFNEERIRGAIPVSTDQLVAGLETTLERDRDIYLYSDSNESATTAANRLRNAGYANVALLQGGLSSWKAIGGSTEGSKAFASPVSS